MSTTNNPTAAWKKAQETRDAMMASKNSVTFVAKDYSCVVYIYDSNFNGKPAATGFIGRSLKPAFSNYFSNAEARKDRVSKFMERVMESKARKSKKNSVARNLEVGDVLVSAWGYDQTNIDYYLVTKLVGKTMVEIIRIGANSVMDEAMAGHCTPDVTDVIGEPMKKKVSGYTGDSVAINSFANARKLTYTLDENGDKVFPKSRWSAYH